MPASAVAAQVDPALVSWATGGTGSSKLPASSAQVIEVHRLSTDFRAATHIVRRPLPAALPPGTVLIRRAYVGINASDVNYSGVVMAWWAAHTQCGRAGACMLWSDPGCVQLVTKRSHCLTPPSLPNRSWALFWQHGGGRDQAALPRWF